MTIPPFLQEIMDKPEPELAEWIAKIRDNPVLKLGIRTFGGKFGLDIDNDPMARAVLDGRISPEQGARLVKLAGKGGTNDEIRQRIKDDPMVAEVLGL